MHSNERLEFLGDRVLGLIVAETAACALSRRRRRRADASQYNALARRETCASAREAAGSAEHIILAKREDAAGARGTSRDPGRRLRGGDRRALSRWRDDAARGFVERYWEQRLIAALGAPTCAIPRPAAGMGAGARPAAPVYRIVGARARAPCAALPVEVAVEGRRRERGQGGSKREAETGRGGGGCWRARRRLHERRDQRCGYCAIIGAPNAGKSTLVNALVGTKVAIVTPKVQTTRMNVRGVAMRGETQIVFVDTPGIFSPAAGSTAPWSPPPGPAPRMPTRSVLLVDAARDLDADPQGIGARDTDAIIEGLKAAPKSRWRSTRSTRMKRADLLPLAERLHADGVFEQVFMISRPERRRRRRSAPIWFAARMPEGPWLYPEDQAADMPSRLLAAEITREKIYLRLHRRTALRHRGRDREVGGAQGRLGQDRPDRSMSSATARRRSCSARAAPRSRRSASWRAGRWRECSAAACISSCSSRCARTGPRSASTTRDGPGVPEELRRMEWEDDAIVLSARRYGEGRSSWSC